MTQIKITCMSSTKTKQNKTKQNQTKKPTDIKLFHYLFFPLCPVSKSIYLSIYQCICTSRMLHKVNF